MPRRIVKEQNEQRGSLESAMVPNSTGLAPWEHATIVRTYGCIGKPPTTNNYSAPNANTAGY